MGKEVIRFAILSALLTCSFLNGCSETSSTSSGLVSQTSTSDMKNPKVALSSLFPWMEQAKEATIEKVCFSDIGNGLAPGHLNTHRYSTDESEITKWKGILSAQCQDVYVICAIVPGAPINTYSFFYEETEHSFRTVGGLLYVDGVYYELDVDLDDFAISNPTTVAYSLLTYGTSGRKVKRVSDGTEAATINGIDQIRFEPLPVGAPQPSNPLFYIDDNMCVSSPLYIYSATEISYGGSFYRIITEKNFSELF